MLGGWLQQRKAAVSGEGTPAGVPLSSQRRSPIHSPAGSLPALPRAARVLPPPLPPLSAVLKRGRQPAAKCPAVRGAGERAAGGRAGTAISSDVELAPRQLRPPAAAGEEASGTATRGHLAPCNRGSLSPVWQSLPRYGSLALRRPLSPREESLVCGIFPPTFGTGPGREGAAAGAGGGEGGSNLLFIYLFSSFLPQVAMVIPSSLSLRSRGDGYPFVSIPLPLRSRCFSLPAKALPSLPAPRGRGRDAPSTWLRILSARPRLPSTLPRLPSVLPRLPSVSSRLTSALPASD